MMNTTFLIISILMFVAVILVVEAIYTWWNSVHGPEAKRMAERLRRMSAGGHSSQADQALLKQRLLSDSQSLHRLLVQLPRIGVLDRLLVQTGTETSVASFLAACTALFFAGALVSLIFGVPVLIALAVGGLFACLPLQRMWSLKNKRLAQFERLLPEAIDLIGRSMQAGHAFPSAVQMVGEEMPDPIGGEFRATFDEINFGVSSQDAMLNLSTRVPSQDLAFFVIAVLIQRETGGNLTEVLGNISSIIRDRLKLHGRVRVLSAEGRLSAVILTALPFVVAGGFFLLNPKNMSLLWTTQYGLVLIYTSIVMMVVGIIWVRNAVQIRV